MTEAHDDFYNPMGWSISLHIVLAAVMLTSWAFLSKQETISPPAMMKASLVHAPKSTLAPQQKTQIQKPEPKKQEETKPEPPKPKVEPKEVKPPVKPTDKPSPVAAKKEPPKPPAPDKTKPDPKKPEKAKPDSKKAEKKQEARSQVDKEKQRKDAEAALAAAMEVEDNVLIQGDLNNDDIAKYIGLIASRIADNWSRPPNARRDMTVVLEIELLQTGQVVNVRIVQSSGNRAFDLAAEAAVRKVERFEAITDMKPELFNKTFRKFQLLFNPEDLLI